MRLILITLALLLATPALAQPAPAAPSHNDNSAALEAADRASLQKQINDLKAQLDQARRAITVCRQQRDYQVHILNDQLLNASVAAGAGAQPYP